MFIFLLQQDDLASPNIGSAFQFAVPVVAKVIYTSERQHHAPIDECSARR
jgi:hypothetical protein